MESLDILAVVLWATALFCTLRFVVRTVFVSTARFFGFYSPAYYSKFLARTVGWRELYGRLWIPIRALISDNRPNTSQKFSSFLERCYNVYRKKRGDIPIGLNQISSFPLMMPVSISGNTGRHICMFAAAGSGKTVYLVSLLSLTDSNFFCVDVDSQIYSAIGKDKAKTKDVFVLDPDKRNPTGKTDSWNPMFELDAARNLFGNSGVVNLAKTLSAALIPIPPQSGQNQWCFTGARELLFSIIMFVYVTEPPERRNLLTVRRLLTKGLETGIDPNKHDAFDNMIFEMKNRTEFNGIISESASLFSGQNKGKEAMLMTAKDLTSWISLPQMANILKTSDFKCEDLKVGNTALFIVASATDIQDKLKGWVRTLTMVSMEFFQKIPERPKQPCLYAIDEMPSLQLEILATASPVFRKYGIRLLTISQDLELLESAYPKTWGGFLGNAECIIWGATQHKESLEYLSSILGTHSRTETVKPRFWFVRRWFSNQRPHTQQNETSLLSPSKLGEMLGRNLIVTRNGARPHLLKPFVYYKELPVFKYEADRFYGEKPLRRFTRSVCFWVENELPIYRQRSIQFLTRKRQKVKGFVSRKVQSLKRITSRKTKNLGG